MRAGCDNGSVGMIGGGGVSKMMDDYLSGVCLHEDARCQKFKVS